METRVPGHGMAPWPGAPGGIDGTGNGTGAAHRGAACPRLGRPRVEAAELAAPRPAVPADGMPAPPDYRELPRAGRGHRTRT